MLFVNKYISIMVHSYWTEYFSATIQFNVQINKMEALHWGDVNYVFQRLTPEFVVCLCFLFVCLCSNFFQFSVVCLWSVNNVLFTLFALVCAEWYPTHVVLCFSSSCVPYVDSFSGLSIFDCPFGILYGLSIFDCPFGILYGLSIFDYPFGILYGLSIFDCPFGFL